VQAVHRVRNGIRPQIQDTSYQFEACPQSRPPEHDPLSPIITANVWLTASTWRRRFPPALAPVQKAREDLRPGFAVAHPVRTAVWHEQTVT